MFLLLLIFYLYGLRVNIITIIICYTAAQPWFLYKNALHNAIYIYISLKKKNVNRRH